MYVLIKSKEKLAVFLPLFSCALCLRKQYLCFGAVEHSPFSQIMQTSIPLPTNAKEKITGLYEQRLPPPPFASVYRNLPFFYNGREREWSKKSYVIGYNQQRRVYIQ